MGYSPVEHHFFLTDMKMILEDVCVQPFVDSDHAIHSYFLPREYSVILPGVAALILLLCVGTFIGIVTWKNRKPKKAD
ncbi:hypothetical protein QTP70_018525 [Hemibagrus guttatus]|uniref:Dolichol phosphate-mannose biosynthesis regulatory protein n=1 Tax=Hemibagrus guttatus TaxID=175788 RepID=A0AAE0PVP8_9TELE|nr:hypothetical protein QTP70_018525 [Hemibagrus guttatus]